MNTETVTHLISLIYLSLHWVTWLHGLLHSVNPGYRGIITHSWFNLSIMECCSTKEMAHCIKCLNILQEIVKGTLGMILVVEEI